MTRRRSAKQNAYLWGHVYQRIAQKTGHTPDAIHDLLCQWFLPRPTVRRLSNWPDGEIRVITRQVAHTSALTPAQFQIFVDQVRLFAKSCLGVETDDPDYQRYGAAPW